ncbi:MAG: RelA/SpoT family protein [Bdellovibrionota bacterium]|jgi:guanosine-3',5'-bis(diphosphate) 3'-pyrophosphohydrolase
MQFDDIITSIKSYYPNPDVDLIRKAYDYAESVHRGQVRASGEPYFIHLVETAYIVTQLKLDIPSVIAALLHDTIEDCDVSKEYICKEFGQDVADIVEGVTNLTRLQFGSVEEKQAESFRKMLLAMSKDIRVILVKICDRLHNMRTLQHLSEEKQRRKSLETKEIYAPLANRLGLHWIKSELEDYCLLYLRPELFYEIKNTLDKTERERDEYARKTSEEISKVLEDAGITAKVKGRAKHYYSIWQKMEKQNLSIEEIHDLLGFRIIVSTVRICYETLGVIHAAWKPVPGRFKDYIAMPKPNMYQSLHTVVIGPEGQRIEIQVRTHEMDQVAEEGIAAHWRYKEGNSASAFNLHWVKDLVESQQYLKNPDEFMQSVKGELFPEEVFVFTPKGDLIRLPYKSTPVDFAYAVHTDIGHTTIGARVNGSIVPLNYILRHGDTIEIITSKNQVPNKDWLGFVSSSKARQRIRSFLKSQEHAKSMAIGMEILAKDLRKVKYGLKKLEKSGELQSIAETFGLKSEGDLYAEIGYGKISSSRVVGKLLPEGVDVEEKLNAPPSPLQRIFQKAVDASRDKVGVKVSGADDILVRFAKCCEPLPGDRIVGFITRGRGVTIHNVNCSQVLGCDPQRCVEVRWDTEAKAPRRVKLAVHSLDQKGILASITKTINDNGGDIKSAQIRTTEFGKAVIALELAIENARQLNKIRRAIEMISGVIRVERIHHFDMNMDHLSR